MRKLDDGGDYEGAVKLAVADRTSTAFEKVTADIGAALEQRKAAFAEELGAAGRGLGLLAVLGPLVALVVCALAAAGLRARIEEYR